MSDEALRADLVQRIEELVRENERLANRVADLEPAVGHVALLVQLLRVVREWGLNPTEELKQEMLNLVKEYDVLRRR